MINIERPAQAPASLQSPKVRHYLECLAKHKQDPKQNPEPEKPSGYRNSDLLEVFDTHFFSKCYLTEQRFGSAWAMDVEHFSERPEVVFEWTNLYPADHTANMMKWRKTPDGGYLDPCSPDDDVETEIQYALIEFGKEPRFDSKDVGNTKAVNTSKLLHLLHNGKNNDAESANRTKHLRTLIKTKYDEVMKALAEWLHWRTDESRKLAAAETLKILLSRRASFTMLMRSIDSVQDFVPKDFLD
ncbi:MAG: hypothetical protein ACKVUS_00370 [Saprospiraceae bacterium]